MSRHQRGYETYRRATDQRRHSVRSTYLEAGTEYCSECTYPVTRSKRRGRGNCYKAAARVILEAIGTPDVDELVLCHGIVTGSPGSPIAGMRYGHAWVERDIEFEFPDGMVATVRWVIDRSNGRDIEQPAETYYRNGRIAVDEVRRYGAREAMKLLHDRETYGPWEPGLSPEVGL